MKRRFTAFKAALGMFAIVFSTSCQKEAVSPAGQEENTSALMVKSGMYGTGEYRLTDAYGENTGEIVLYNNQKYAAISVKFDSRNPDNHSKLSALIVNKGGEKVAILSDLKAADPKTEFAAAEQPLRFESVTDPVLNIKTNEKITVDQLYMNGMRIVIHNQYGKTVATGNMY